MFVKTLAVLLQPGLLEPCAVKVARTGLRGGGGGDIPPLPDGASLKSLNLSGGNPSTSVQVDHQSSLRPKQFGGWKQRTKSLIARRAISQTWAR